MDSSEYIVFYVKGLYEGIYDIRTKSFIKVNYKETTNFLYRAFLINLDGVLIDLRQPEMIKKIDTKMKIDHTSSSVGILENDLRFTAAYMRENGYHNEALLVYRTALDIADRYVSFWEPAMYITYLEWLYEDRKDKEGDEYSKHIRRIVEEKKHFYDRYYSITAMNNRNFWVNSDYVYVSRSPICSSICAIHSERIYRNKGKDKRFPKLPQNVKKNGNFGEDCNCQLFDGFAKSIEITNKDGKIIRFEGDDAVKYSNRPLVDNRTLEEINRYDDFVSRPSKKDLLDQRFDNFQEKAKLRGKSYRLYTLVVENLLELAPKSANGLYLMMLRNTANYQKICALLYEKGFDVEKV